MLNAVMICYQWKNMENILNSCYFSVLSFVIHIGREMGATPLLPMIGHCVKEAESDWLGKASLHAGTGKP